MSEASAVQKDEEQPSVFTYNLALTQSSTYYKWRHIGTEQHLMTDEEIACFLFECYDRRKTGTSSGGGVCSTCQSLLILSCLNCGMGGSLADSDSSPGVTSQAAETGGHANSMGTSAVREGTTDQCTDDSQGLKKCSTEYRMNLRSRQRVVPPVLGRNRGQVLRSSVSRQTKDLHDESKGTSLSSAPQADQTPNHSMPAGTESSKETLLSDGRPDDLNPVSEDDSMSCFWEQQHKEEVCDSSEDTNTVSVSQKPHTGRGRPRKYPYIPLECSVCHKKLSTRMSVVNHMKKKHPETKLPESYNAVLSRTMPRKGPGQERGHKGTSIDKAVKEADDSADQDEAVRSEVSEAMKQLRKAELESLKCSTCGVQFEHKRQMYTHRRLCMPKVCHLCGKSVKQLEMHLKRHTSDRRFPCPHCPKSFLFRNYLEQHMLYHNNERPYCCEICGMRYREKTRLNAHIRTHTGSKPYKCKQCNAAFTRARGLSDHMRVHTGEKPYSCQVCGRQFSSSGNLAAHRRKVHGLQPQVPNRMTRKLFEVESAQPGSCESGGMKTNTVNPAGPWDVCGIITQTDTVGSTAVSSPGDILHPAGLISTGVTDNNPSVLVSAGATDNIPGVLVSTNECVSDGALLSASSLASSVHVNSGAPGSAGVPASGAAPVSASVRVEGIHVGTGDPVSAGASISTSVLVNGGPVSGCTLVSAGAPVSASVSGVPASAGTPVNAGIPLCVPLSAGVLLNPLVPASNCGIFVSTGVPVIPGVPANNTGVPARVPVSPGVPVNAGVPVHHSAVGSPGLADDRNMSNSVGHSAGVR